MLNHVLLRPLPFSEPGRLVTFFQTRAGEAPIRSFAAAGAYTMTPLNLGIHGLISFIASRRRHEVGVRVALGATRLTILGSAMLIAILMACAGSLVPAVRIASVNPNEALRAG